MAEPEDTPAGAREPAPAGDGEARFEDVRQLWAGRFQAVLTTWSLAEPGYPFPSVVPYCLDRQGRVLLLLSHLAQHTKNLEAEARCGLSVAEACDEDVQQSLRIACTADAAPVAADDASSHARWFRYFPASRMYFEQLNFRLWRLTPRRIHVNGGFATARWLGVERVLRESPLDDPAETRLIAALAPGSATTPDAVRIAGIDPWGLDLARGERLWRVPLEGELATLEALRDRAARALAESAGADGRDPGA